MHLITALLLLLLLEKEEEEEEEEKEENSQVLFSSGGPCGLGYSTVGLVTIGTMVLYARDSIGDRGTTQV